MKHALAIVVVLGAVAFTCAARADVVDACPHAWQTGNDGHGMTCETSWPVVGAGAGLCAFVGLVVAGLGLLAARRPHEGRSRGD